MKKKVCGKGYGKGAYLVRGAGFRRVFSLIMDFNESITLLGVNKGYARPDRNTVDYLLIKRPRGVTSFIYIAMGDDRDTPVTHGREEIG